MAIEPVIHPYEGMPALARMSGPIFAGMSGRGVDCLPGHTLRSFGSSTGRSTAT